MSNPRVYVHTTKPRDGPLNLSCPLWEVYLSLLFIYLALHCSIAGFRWPIGILYRSHPFLSVPLVITYL
jgi:hypothetical protein